MPSTAMIEDFLAQPELAFVGVSRDPKSFSNTAYRALRAAGHTMHPVHPTADRLEGDGAVQRLTAVPKTVGGVVVMLPAEAALAVVREALAAGIPRVWLHRGIGRGSATEEAIRLCREQGITVVDGACPMMFLEPVRGIHRLHRRLSRRVTA